MPIAFRCHSLCFIIALRPNPYKLPGFFPKPYVAVSSLNTARMGSTHTLSGHLLCAIPFPESKEVSDQIRASHPDLKITFISSKLAVNWEKSSGVPSEIWPEVKYLCTLSEFPPDLAQAPNLCYVHLLSAGTDHIWNKPIYTSSQVPITTSNGILAPTIAEWVTLTSLAASRRFDDLRQRQFTQSWSETDGGKTVFQGIKDRAGQRMGILGYGAIGRQAARVASALGMDVIVHTASPRPTAESRRDDGYIVPSTGDPDGTIPSAWFSGVDRASLHHFLSQDIDQLLVCVPLTSHTRMMLGHEEFKILARRNAFVMNVSRGEIIDQDALVVALNAFETDVNGVIGKGKKGLRGAALDVTSPEPLPKGHPLWTAPNCIITPHISGVSSHYGPRGLELLKINLDRIQAGEKLINLVNRKTGYPSKE